MDILTDVALLSRIQFALTVAYHFIFVPLSIGLGLITAIFATLTSCISVLESIAANCWTAWTTSATPS